MEQSGIRTGIRRLGFFALVLLVSAIHGGCGGGGGGGEGSDTTPDTFSFTDRTDAPLSAPIASNTITVSGINAVAPISVTNGEYAINGSSYTSTAGTVSNDQSVTIRQTSSSTVSTQTTATLTIGGVSDDFTVTTCTQDYSGLYTGTGTVNGTSNLTAVRGMWRNERFILFDVGENILYDGTVQSYGTAGEVTGTVNVYKNGVNSQQTTVTGTAAVQSQIALILNGTGYGSGSITLTYSNLYERGATLGKFAAVAPDLWLGTINTVTNTTTMGLRAPTTDNSFFAVTNGAVSCEYRDGTKTIPNAAVNLYQVSFNSFDIGDKCNHDGTNFTGFATVVDGSVPDNIMWFAATNGTNSNFSMLDYVNVP